MVLRFTVLLRDLEASLHYVSMVAFRSYVLTYLQIHCRPDTFLENLLNVSRMEVRKALSRLRLPVDRDRYIKHTNLVAGIFR